MVHRLSVSIGHHIVPDKFPYSSIVSNLNNSSLESLQFSDIRSLHQVIMSPTSDLPPAVSKFLQAIHNLNSDDLVSTFADDFIMIDESKPHNSREHVREWSEEGLVSRHATIKVLDVTTTPQSRTAVHVLVDGDYAHDFGITEPFHLYMNFAVTLDGQKITELRVGDIAPNEPTMRAVWASRGDLKDPLSQLRNDIRRVPIIPEGWVRVNVKAVGLNYHDIFTLKGVSMHQLTYPLILGSEVAGTLEDGTEVVIYPAMGNPQWNGDITLDPDRHVLGEVTQGSLAEFVAVPKENVLPKPKGMSMTTASVLGIAWLTAYRMLFTRSGLQSGQTMLVQGSSGGVTTALIQLGRAAGMTVWCTGRSEQKRKLAEQLGAHRTFEPSATLPSKVDAVFDVSGAATLDHSIHSVKAGGSVVTAGAHSADGGKASIDLQHVFVHQISLIGNYLGNKDEFEALIAFVAEKGIEPYISEVLPLDQAEEGFRKLYDGEVAGKVVITI